MLLPVEYRYVEYGLQGLVASLEVGVAVSLFMRMLRRNKARWQQAQHEAVAVHNAVTVLLFDMGQLSLPPDQRAVYERLAVAYVHFHMSGQGDPTIDHLSIDAYNTMRWRYADMRKELQRAATLHQALACTP
jgi:hypothetical protein